MDNQTVSRRNFLKTSAVTGAVFSLGFYWPGNAKSAKVINAAEAKSFGVEMNSWVHINASGRSPFLTTVQKWAKDHIRPFRKLWPRNWK